MQFKKVQSYETWTVNYSYVQFVWVEGMWREGVADKVGDDLIATRNVVLENHDHRPRYEVNCVIS